jgi:hypothetical protein
MIRSEKLTMHGRKGLDSAESPTRTVREGSRKWPRAVAGRGGRTSGSRRSGPVGVEYADEAEP